MAGYLAAFIVGVLFWPGLKVVILCVEAFMFSLGYHVCVARACNFRGIKWFGMAVGFFNKFYERAFGSDGNVVSISYSLEGGKHCTWEPYFRLSMSERHRTKVEK